MANQVSRRQALFQTAAIPVAAAALAITSPQIVVASEAEHRELMSAYSAWLHYERMHLNQEVWPHVVGNYDFIPTANAGARYHFQPWGEPAIAPASTRAAAVLAAVGCDWRQG